MQCSDHVVFFFSSRRRHTRLQGDWSSDVCSSDLDMSGDGIPALARVKKELMRLAKKYDGAGRPVPAGDRFPVGTREIGRASCRERVEVSEGAGTAER